eukprot:SAG11_NODE_1152_length_5663_cov_110.803379_2_plen_70_part_00
MTLPRRQRKLYEIWVDRSQAPHLARHCGRHFRATHVRRSVETHFPMENQPFATILFTQVYYAGAHIGIP